MTLTNKLFQKTFHVGLITGIAFSAPAQVQADSPVPEALSFKPPAATSMDPILTPKTALTSLIHIEETIAQDDMSAAQGRLSLTDSGNIRLTVQSDETKISNIIPISGNVIRVSKNSADKDTRTLAKESNHDEVYQLESTASNNEHAGDVSSNVQSRQATPTIQ